MQKLDTLREALANALPELKRNPENLRIWIERGSARCQGTTTEAFGFAFQANVVIFEMASDIAVMAHAVFRWLRVNQPELLVPGNEGFAFDAEILDNGCADVMLQIQLTQNATVNPAQDSGSHTIEWLPEPDPLFTDGLGLGNANPVPPLAGVDFAEDVPPWNP